MEEHKAHKGCAAGNGMVGMVIGGRAAKACDVCGKERARWYCAADLAYLCERCDGSVHAANALARRHERVRLGPNGAPVKIPRSTPAANVSKRDAPATAAQPPAAHFNPRKRPRSIRRHKPSSLHASKHGMSLIHASNYNNGGSILIGSNLSIMINNPRNDPEFVDNINNNNDDFFNKVFIKAEPLSPIDIGDQVKVPDHTDMDDPLLESLFDFRDLHDDDLFLHEVPIYNPQLVQSQDIISHSTLHNEQCEEEEEKEEDEAKPIIIPLPSDKSTLDVFNTSSFAIHHPSYLSQAEGADDQDVPVALPLGKCDLPNQFNIDSDNNSICDLDQLDFDSVLHGNDEDGDEMDHVPSMGGSPFHVHDDSKECNYTEISHGQTLIRDEDGYGNGMENTNGQLYNGHIHTGYGENAFDFDARGSESPRTWLCKVKVESPPQLGMMNEDKDVLLREKLSACQSLCSGSPNGFKLGLRLNFEDVLNAWSDKGTFWMDGQPPQQLSSCLDFLGGWMVPDMNSPSMEGSSEGQQLVPVLHHKHNSGDGGARKASVLRYREKRRTRLFCKKIRYEVRKLNAEKRPRMKGRFVKRIPIVV